MALGGCPAYLSLRFCVPSLHRPHPKLFVLTVLVRSLSGLMLVLCFLYSLLFSSPVISLKMITRNENLDSQSNKTTGMKTLKIHVNNYVNVPIAFLPARNEM